MSRAKGMFISYYQESFKNLGNLDYIFQRTSDGLWTDARYYEMLPQVKTIKNRGAVHNFRPDKDWAEQAKLFLDLSSGEGFNVLCGDYESGVLDAKAAKDFWCFLKRLEEQRPLKKIIFYTNLYILRDSLMPHQGKETVYGPIDWEYFDQWIAQYPVRNNPDGTSTLLADPQTAEPYLSIQGEVVREKPPVFWQYWAGGNQQGAKYGCGSRDTNLDVFFGAVEECNKYFRLDTEEPAGLEARVNELTDKVNKLSTRLLDFDLALSIQDDTNRVQNEIMTVLDGKARANASAVTELQSLVTANSQGIAELARRFDTLQQGQIDAAESQLALEDRVGEHDVKLDSLYGTQGDISERVTNLEAESVFWDLNIDNHNALVDEVNAMDVVVQANAVDIEKNRLEIDDCVDSEAFNAVVARLESDIKRIDNKTSGHTHFWQRLFKRLQ